MAQQHTQPRQKNCKADKTEELTPENRAAKIFFAENKFVCQIFNVKNDLQD